MTSKQTIVLYYALAIALIHHFVLHMWLQPILNGLYGDLYASWPSFLLGSTAIVTLGIFILAYIGGTILTSRKKY